MSNCKFRRGDGTICGEQTELTFDKRFSCVDAQRNNKGELITLRAYYPTIPADFCHYHDKLMKGMLDDHRGQNIKKSRNAGRY